MTPLTTQQIADEANEAQSSLLNSLPKSWPDNHSKLHIAELTMTKILLNEAGMSEEDATDVATRFADVFRGLFAELFI